MGTVHTEKSFRNIGNSNQSRIVITLFLLIQAPHELPFGAKSIIEKSNYTYEITRKLQGNYKGNFLVYAEHVRGGNN